MMQQIENIPETKQPTPFWKNWKVVLGIFVILSLIITAVIRVITPYQVSVPVSEFATTNIDTKESKIEKLTFTGQALQGINNEYNIYKAELRSATDTLLPVLLERYQLKQLQTTKGVWAGPEYSMTHDPIENVYNLTRNEEPPAGKRIALAQATTTAENYIRELQISSASPFPSKALFFEDPVEMSYTNEFKAEIIIVPFAPSIENVPLLFNNASFYPYQVMINSDYQVQKFSFQPYAYTATVLRKAPLIKIDDAVDNILKGKGAIINVGLVQYDIPSISSITTGTLDTVQLEYRLDPTLQLLYPFYRFSGRLTNNNNETFNAELFTPAIRTN